MHHTNNNHTLNLSISTLKLTYTGTHVKSDQGVRSIAVSDSQTYGELLWINNEFLDEVVRCVNFIVGWVRVMFRAVDIPLLRY